MNELAELQAIVKMFEKLLLDNCPFKETTIGESMILRALEQSKCNITDLSKKIGISKSGISQTVSKMVKKNLVRKVYEDKNIYIEMTPDAIQTFSRDKERYKRYALKLFSLVDREETKQFLEFSKKLYNIMSKILKEEIEC